ncbi:hypothetical protein J2T55_000502 [Methylohalomonas lacus]|uniref:Uncharacterized protein n=1 Tax=Methylohalomonas lacus TaxID=398773 RepID=A0AAE3L3P6_9GAMM|nr:hypothetical protein [Methylohalomonas lacus]MCS3902498.1 hypothetical protein [Methylohalomonas lacus]
MTREEKQRAAATGAYARDGRGDDRYRAVASGWHPTFDRLLGSGHIFMGYHYSAGGLLFRGMPAGAAKALREDRFWHSDFDNPLCQLERDLDVVFCSEVARDALAVARPWEDGREDAAILVFASDCFNQRWQQRSAAALGFADVGMVFKYPCLAEPLRSHDLLAVLAHPALAASMTTSVALLSPEQPASRDAWQALLDEWLAAQTQSPARALPTDLYPRRS